MAACGLGLGRRAFSSWFVLMPNGRMTTAARSRLCRLPSSRMLQPRMSLCSAGNSKPPSTSEKGSASTAPDGDKSAAEVAPPGHFEKFKTMTRKYGPVFVSTYVGMYLCTLGSLFAFFEYKLATAGSSGEIGILMQEYIDWAGLSEYSIFKNMNPAAGSFVMAWAVCKITEPARLAATILITPRVAKMVGRRGA